VVKEVHGPDRQPAIPSFLHHTAAKARDADTGQGKERRDLELSHSPSGKSPAAIVITGGPDIIGQWETHPKRQPTQMFAERVWVVSEAAAAVSAPTILRPDIGLDPEVGVADRKDE
jgi:hypothetical protein